ncbi:MAG: hypothetical protein D5S00_00515 [Tindallia sp. MSAO_Bac2]|nr:MAG: hypothetical protein D5S00_00515 [Tindallia sp. MSAO_Bac2]
MRKFASKSKAFIWGLFNQPYIPEGLAKSEGPLIMHISDTPVQIYQFIYKLAARLKPAVIIHTGDLADNHKIENQTEQIAHYEIAAKRFINGITKAAPSADLYIVAGNHDLIDAIRDFSPQPDNEEQEIELYQRKFFLRHELDIEQDKKGYYCFGHKFEPSHRETEGTVYLNGLLNINIIDAQNWKIYHLEYPYGTNEYRKMTYRRTGL